MRTRTRRASCSTVSTATTLSPAVRGPVTASTAAVAMTTYTGTEATIPSMAVTARIRSAAATATTYSPAGQGKTARAGGPGTTTPTAGGGKTPRKGARSP